MKLKQQKLTINARKVAMNPDDACHRFLKWQLQEAIEGRAQEGESILKRMGEEKTRERERGTRLRVDFLSVNLLL